MNKLKAFVPVVSVLNMKGGVGKSTLCANISLAIFETHAIHTLLLDLDPQFNLTQSIFKRDAYDKMKASAKTIFSIMEPASEVGLFDVAVSNIPPPAASTIANTLFYLEENKSIELDIVPGDFQLVKYSLMDDNAKLKAVKDRFLKFVAQERSNYRSIFIDCNPSSSFLTLCALHAATHVLVPVRPDRFSMLGLEILSEFIENLPTLMPKPHLVVVLNGIRRGGRDKVATAVEAELRAHPKFGPRTLVNFVPESGVLRARTDYTGFATDRKVRGRQQVQAEISAVASELSKKLGLT